MRVVMTRAEYATVKTALDWYASDRRECAKMDEASAVLKGEAKQNWDAADEAEALMQRLEKAYG